MISLHTHTDASDGGTVDAMFTAAAASGYTHVAITDHGTVANHVSAVTKATEHGLTVILGVELYVDYGEKKTGHMTLLAKNKEGLKTIYSLMAMVSKSKGAIHIDDIGIARSGTILLSGCPSSPLNRMDRGDAVYHAKKLERIWGDEFYIETQYTMDQDYIDRSVDLSTALHIPIVLTNDIHIPSAGDTYSHEMLSLIKLGYSFPTKGLHFRSMEEMVKRGMKYGISRQTTVDWLTNAKDIASKYHWDYDLLGSPSIPSDPELTQTMLSHLDTSLERYLDHSRFPGAVEKIYCDRIKNELKVITDMGYLEYFAIVYDIVQYARKNGIPMSPGRGSAAGSLVLYLLEVTDIDPMVDNLLFARFLNPHRGDLPDIDLDFSTDGRDKIIEYAKERWGAHPVSTMLTWKHASLVRDIGRILKLSRDDIESAAIEGTPEFFKFYNNVSSFKSLYDYGKGMIKARGRHASGFVIADRQVPLEPISGGYLCVPWSDGSSRELSSVGLIKFDILGLAILSALEEMRKACGKSPSKFGEDEKSMDVFYRGDTFGVFQFSSPEAIKLTRAYKPTQGIDIAVLGALNRPGPLKSGMAEEAIQHRAKGTRRILGYPEVDEVLKETYGIIVFQEQLMKVFELLAGATLYEADSLRKIVAKKQIDNPLWGKFKLAFIRGCMSKLGYNTAQAESLWGEIEAFADYGFPKAHAVAYGHIAWMCAWYKAHEPVAFFTAMMNWDRENAIQYMAEALEHGVEVVTPHVNMPVSKYSHNGTKIYIPLSQIKFLGVGSAEFIEKERDTNGEFSSCGDFLERVPKRKANKRVIKHMYASGAFDGFDDTEQLPIDQEELQNISAMTVRERERDYMGVVRLTNKTLGVLDSIALKVGGRKNFTYGLVTEITRKNVDKRVYWKVRSYPHIDQPVYAYQKPEFVVGDIAIFKLKPFTHSIEETYIR